MFLPRLFVVPTIILSLTCCARKKTIEQNKETAIPAITNQPKTVQQESVINHSLWKELLAEQYKEIISSIKYLPKKYRMFSIDSVAMRNILSKTVKQNKWIAGDNALQLEFARPDSGFSNFSIYETSVMDSALAAHYPDMKTYGGKGITDASASVRFEFNENGFHAYITDQSGEWFIQPAQKGITHQYLLCFFKKDISDSPKMPFELADSLRK